LSFKNTVFPVRCPWRNPKLCPRHRPNRTPTIDFDFAVGVHHPGDGEKILDSELSPKSIPTI
jgi:hypothetical protein